MVAKNGYCRYFEYVPEKGREFPILDVVNPSDYEIYEVTEEEFKKNENKR
jgi:hypothetical protein